MIRGFLILLLLGGGASCTYLNSVNQTNIPAPKGRPVSADFYEFMFFGFNFSNDDALQIAKDLRASCPHGDVLGVTTKDMTTLYVLFIFWAREIEASGYCVSKQTARVSPPVLPLSLEP